MCVMTERISTTADTACTTTAMRRSNIGKKPTNHGLQNMKPVTSNSSRLTPKAQNTSF
ncbi:Uncharacterised protein [Mycobacterium tuberculosis]|nr:Uncharacterised protein [Mycobacterium tuberculosis]